MTRFRWGIFGTGAISAKFVAGLQSAKNAEASFVASRSLPSAERFAAGAGIKRAICGYAEAAAAGGVDAIYIATPPSEHVSHTLLCIDAGIPVLVEKPFATTAAGAAQIAAAARGRSVFVMEAMWTRFLPAARAMKERVASKDVGEVRLITGSFGISYEPRLAPGMFDPALGGGALAHLGAYPVSLTHWLFGPPSSVQAIGTLTPSGVDEDVAFQMRYADGLIGSFIVSGRAWAPDHFQVLGTGGMIGFTGSIVRPHGLEISRQVPRGAERTQFDLRNRLKQNAVIHQIAQRAGRSSRSVGKYFEHRYAGNGYHYEADEVRARIHAGALESDIMPLDESIAVAGTLDQIRSAVGGSEVEPGPTS